MKVTRSPLARELSPDSSGLEKTTRSSGKRVRDEVEQEVRPFLGTTRFSPMALLGRGGMGVVYRAYDEEMERDVALKTLPALGAAEFVALKEEFRSLTGLTHRNLIELYELFVEGEDAFFTMELLDGTDFVSFVRGKKQAPFKGPALPRGAWVERLAGVLAQLVSAMSFLHNAKKLHRDIKPSNVRVTSSGRAVLLDFGLATALAAGAADAKGTGDMVGTVEYMAPEQAWGTSLSFSADWYAVGVMVYEAITGVLPYEGDAAALIMEKTRAKAKRPSERVSDVPKALDELCARLLEPRPEKRASGGDVLAALRNIGVDVGAQEAADITREAPFLGREAEMRALRAVVEGLSHGRAALARIVGPSGIGKTELVRQFVTQIESERDVLVLHGRCHPQESVPYKAFDGLLDALSRFLVDLPESEVRSFVTGDMGPLLRVFPALSSVDALTRAVSLEQPKEPQELRRRAFDKLGSLLAAIARGRLILAWIDDMQWCDADSIMLMRELLLGAKVPMVFLIAYRAEDLNMQPLLKELDRIALALPAPLSHYLVVEPLAEASARALAAGILGRLAATGGDLITTIAEEAAGSPFFLAELARYVARGSDTDVWRVHKGSGLTALVMSRIDQLKPEERDLLEVISIAGGPMDRSLALKVAKLGEAGRPFAIRLGQACLLRSTEVDGRPAIETYHDRIRESLLVHVSPEQKRNRHRDIATALRELPSPDPEILLRHYLGAEEEREAAPIAINAADRAADKLAFDRAAELYQMALDLGAESLPRWQIEERLAEALTNAGRGADAAYRFQQAAETLSTALPREPAILRLQRRATEQFLRSGYNDEGMAMMRVVLARVGVSMPRTPGEATRSVLTSRAKLLFRGLGFERRDKRDAPSDVMERLDALWGFSTSISMMDHTLADALGVRALLEALELGERSRVAQALGYEASFESAIGGRLFRKRSERMLSDVVALAEETGEPYDQAWAHMAIGTSAWLGAEWARTVHHCDEAAAIFRQRCRGVAWEIAITELYAFSALSQLGRMRELGERLSRALRDAITRGDLFAANNFRLGQMSVVWLAQDRLDECLELAREAASSWRATNYHTQRYHHTIGVTQARLYANEPFRAFSGLEEEWPKLEAAQFLRLECPRVELGHLRGRTALACAAALAYGRGEGAALLSSKWNGARLRKVALSEASRVDRAGIPTAKPFAELLRAGVYCMSGEIETAQTAMRAAEDGFERASMRLYLEATRHCRGTLLGGEKGRALIDRSRAWMEQEGISSPARMVDMLAPGCSGPMP